MACAPKSRPTGSLGTALANRPAWAQTTHSMQSKITNTVSFNPRHDPMKTQSALASSLMHEEEKNGALKGAETTLLRVTKVLSDRAKAQTWICPISKPSSLLCRQGASLCLRDRKALGSIYTNPKSSESGTTMSDIHFSTETRIQTET